MQGCTVLVFAGRAAVSLCDILFFYTCVDRHGCSDTNDSWVCKRRICPETGDQLGWILDLDQAFYVCFTIPALVVMSACVGDVIACVKGCFCPGLMCKVTAAAAVAASWMKDL